MAGVLTVQRCMQVFELPSVLAYPLFYKLVAHGTSALTRDAVLEFLNKHNVVQVRLQPTACPWLACSVGHI